MRLFLATFLMVCLSVPATAQDNLFSDPAPIEDQYIVTLGTLDKITARLSTIQVKQDTPVRFSSLQITMRSCHVNPPEEAPESVAFLEIDEIDHQDNQKRIFTGWMFASSPAVSSLEHPVYDIWVTECKMVSGEASALSE